MTAGTPLGTRHESGMTKGTHSKGEVDGFGSHEVGEEDGLAWSALHEREAPSY